MDVIIEIEQAGFGLDPTIGDGNFLLFPPVFLRRNRFRPDYRGRKPRTLLDEVRRLRGLDPTIGDGNFSLTGYLSFLFLGLDPTIGDGNRNTKTCRNLKKTRV